MPDDVQFGHYRRGNRDDPKYLVLDYVHDKYARVAVAAYADACQDEWPSLAQRLRQSLEATR